MKNLKNFLSRVKAPQKREVAPVVLPHFYEEKLFQYRYAEFRLSPNRLFRAQSRVVTWKVIRK